MADGGVEEGQRQGTRAAVTAAESGAVRPVPADGAALLTCQVLEIVLNLKAQGERGAYTLAAFISHHTHTRHFYVNGRGTGGGLENHKILFRRCFWNTLMRDGNISTVISLMFLN